ncbi:hypothetical protein [uncultured Pseudoxanthomonas sp.]|uniref:hypothetical protein n=1 Tax=uncultured Pseudoxanthomonas sp. TaxID=281701 RepID=UPI00261EC221|nr:hypothetical protein [uncultured Pseudoxanthomonas sp.]
MKTRLHCSPDTYCKTGIALVTIAVFLFLEGLAKDPVPSDEVRRFLVAGLSVGGVLLYVAGKIASAKRR